VGKGVKDDHDLPLEILQLEEKFLKNHWRDRFHPWLLTQDGRQRGRAPPTPLSTSHRIYMGLIEVSYNFMHHRRAPWLTGSYHPRFHLLRQWDSKVGSTGLARIPRLGPEF
jgi:hypothetical protein